MAASGFTTVELKLNRHGVRRHPRVRRYALRRGLVWNLDMASYAVNRPPLRKMPMPTNLETLQAEVLRLSPADRARLLDRLVASLDVDESAEAAWDELADKREKELGSRSVESVPLEVAVARLEARFSG
jgi:hypothetical protein